MTLVAVRFPPIGDIRYLTAYAAYCQLHCENRHQTSLIFNIHCTHLSLPLVHPRDTPFPMSEAQ